MPRCSQRTSNNIGKLRGGGWGGNGADDEAIGARPQGAP